MQIYLRPVMLVIFSPSDAIHDLPGPQSKVVPFRSSTVMLIRPSDPWNEVEDGITAKRKEQIFVISLWENLQGRGAAWKKAANDHRERALNTTYNGARDKVYVSSSFTTISLCMIKCRQNEPCFGIKCNFPFYGFYNNTIRFDFPLRTCAMFGKFFAKNMFTSSSARLLNYK